MPATRIRLIQLADAEISEPDARLIRDYGKHRLLAEHRKPETVRTGERYLTHWAIFVHDSGRTLRSATMDDAMSFNERWQVWGWSVSHRTHLIATLRNFHKWLILYRNATANPWDVIRSPKQPQRVANWITPYEFERMTQQFCRPCWRDRRDRAVLEFFWSTACRLHGLIDLDLGKIALERRRAIVHEKGDKERVVYLTERCIKHLRLYLDEVRPMLAKTGTAVFVGQHGERMQPSVVREIVYRAAAGARIGRTVTPHTLRHSVATLMLRGGADLRYVQEVLGHSQISTTQIYTHLDDVEVERAHLRFHPDGRLKG